MKVFKFGGGSIQSSAAIRQLAKIVAAERPAVIVVSAMGKTTQVLERIVRKGVAYQAYAEDLKKLFDYHQAVIDNLLTTTRQAAQQRLFQWQSSLASALQGDFETLGLDWYYSQVVAWGEMISSNIIQHYLQEQQMACHWLDARQVIKTNKGYCNAAIDWKKTQGAVEQYLKPLCVDNAPVLTQGFIGSNVQGETTTLGKEGSDFTGAILAASLSAQSLTIWKDVPGIMSGDPKHFKNTVKFEQLSYTTMLQMSLYGAKVIHPKTIQPLADHNIPLYVRPFEKPEEAGTKIVHRATYDEQPIHLLLENQCLITLRTKGSGKLTASTLQPIIQQFDAHTIPFCLLASEVHSVVICCSHQPLRLAPLLQSLQDSDYSVSSQAPVDLITIMHPDLSTSASLAGYGPILFEQQSSERYQVAFQRMD